MTVSAFDGVDKKAKPERSLLETVKKNAGRNSYPFAWDGKKVKLTIVYKAGKATISVNDAKTPLVETEEHARVLRQVKSGRLRFNGTSVRLLSLSVASPGKGDGRD